MGSVSYWQHAYQERATTEAGAPLHGEQQADVAIIGAGITGTALALWLARAGVRVAVVEARHIAAGASGRNGGFLLGGTSETYAAAIATYGHERARRIWSYSVANQQLATGVLDELAAEGWPACYWRNGSLRIAATAQELDDIQAGIEALRKDGWAAESVSREQLPPVLREHYLGAALYPLDGELQPVTFVNGVAALARRAGAQIFEHSAVLDVTRGAGSVTLQTAEGSLTAPQVVIATNAWLPEVGARFGAPWLAQAITPTRGQMLATAPVAERLFTCPCYADEGYQYWRQLEDGRLVVGGWRNTSFATEYTSDETPGGVVQQHLDAFVHEALGLPTLAIEQRWAGIMAFSRDGLPLVGALPGVPGCWISGGYTGHGNAYALHAARTIADALLGAPHADADLFNPARFA